MEITGEERPCPVCDSSSYTLFASEHLVSDEMTEYTYASRKTPEFMRLRLVRCNSCGLVYAPILPSPGQLHCAYAEASYDSSEEAHCAARTYAKILAPHLKEEHLRGAAVDIGAGNGALLPLLRQLGFASVVGIEPSRAAIAAAPPEFLAHMREGMFTPEMIADTTPSLIVSCMTLEHVPDPAKLLTQAHLALNPGGMAMVVVHNRKALLNRILGLRSPIIDIEHLQLFHPTSIRQLLRNTGFVDIEVRSFANTYPLRYWIRLLPVPSAVRDFMHEICARTGLLDKHLTFPVGNMVATGTKPEM
jgi:SAM-dependent methyltransferase